jgi:hypothetical protein
MYFTCGKCDYTQPMFLFSSIQYDTETPCCIWGVSCRLCGFAGISHVPDKIWNQLMSLKEYVGASNDDPMSPLMPNQSLFYLN